MKKINNSKNPEWIRAYLDVEEKERNDHFQAGAFKKVLSEILQFPVLFYGGVFFTLSSTLFFLIQPKVIAVIIDDVIIKKNQDELVFYISLFICVELLRVISTFSQEYIFSFLGQKVMQDLRVRVFTHIQKLPASLFDKTPAGKLVTRVTNDVASLADMFTSGFISILGNIVLIIGIIIALFIVNVKIALITMSVFPVVVVLSVFFTQKLKLAYRDARSKLSALNAFLAENISGMKIVHLFNRQESHLNRFNSLNKWYSDAQISSIKVFSLFHPVITIFTGMSMGLAIWFGSQAVMTNVITIGAFAMITSYIMSVFKPLRDIADRWNMFLSGMASAERIFSILSWTPEKNLSLECEVRSNAHKIRGDIEFKNVWFAYSDELWVLKGLNLKIKAGEKVGVVGPTGSGKTTLVQLLLRLYEPQKGEILIDGKNIQDWEKRSLRAHFGLIQQDVFLFSGSVSDNINLWEEQSHAVGEYTEDSLIEKFPEIKNELNKELQERGVNLSLGQRQVISFLRAAYHAPDIWILDEASANIDSTSEIKLEKLFRENTQGKTALVIAHRLSSVKDSDKIIVLFQGEIIEQGKHLDLIQFNGLYNKLYSYQQNIDEVGFFG